MIVFNFGTGDFSDINWRILRGVRICHSLDKDFLPVLIEESFAEQLEQMAGNRRRRERREPLFLLN